MPVEIREVIIRATIRDAEIPPSPPPSTGVTELESIVEQCVEQVLQILEDREQR